MLILTQKSEAIPLAQQNQSVRAGPDLVLANVPKRRPYAFAKQIQKTAPVPHPDPHPPPLSTLKN